MQDLTQDIRHGIRILAKSPQFTVLAVLTLALGIGGSTAVFSVVEARLFRPLPFEQPEELLWITQSDTAKGWDRIRLSAPNFVDLRSQATSFEFLAASRGGAKTVLASDAPARREQFFLVTPAVFPMLAIQPAEGRVFDGEDGFSVAMISQRFRLAHFGGEEDVIGRTLTTEDGVYEIVGVLPERLYFPPLPEEVAPDVWAPLDLSSDELASRGAPRLTGYGRLRDGVTAEQARVELDAIMTRLAESYPDTNTNVGASLGPLGEWWHDSVRQESPVLLAAVGFVLLIGCANIANLLLARLQSRRGEMSVRIALGASRGRLVRQLLTESLLLAAAGGAFGLPLAYWGAEALAAISPPMVALVGEIEVDGRVLGFSMLATLVSGLLFGVIPALDVPTQALSGRIRSSGLSLVGGQGRLRSALIVGEITLALVSLVAAGLMLRGMAKAVFDSPGFNPDRLLTFRTSAPPGGPRGAADAAAFHAQALERIGGLPGVKAVALANRVPMSMGGDSRWFRIEGRTDDPSDVPPVADYRMISPGYFRTMESPLLAGRPFDRRDDDAAPRVAIVNKSFVDRFLPGESVLGRRLFLRNDPSASTVDTPGTPVRIVGVVAGEKYWRLDALPQPEIYVPFAQQPARTIDFAVRAEGDPTQIADAVRAEIAAMDPTRPLFDIQSMEQRMGSVLAMPRFTTILLGLFAALGLMLAAIGVYGVMAQAVTERTREIGLRAALGASRADLLKLMFSRGVRLIAAGLALGFGCALAVSRLLQHLYHFRGVSPRDPATFAVAASTLLLAALLACYLPARRASRIEPMEALRNE